MRANVFARESDMLKPKRGGNGASQRERGGGFPSFALAPTLRVIISTLPNLPPS